MENFDFLKREGQEEAEELDDGGNADDELDDREVEDRRSIKRAKQGNRCLKTDHKIAKAFWNNCPGTFISYQRDKPVVFWGLIYILFEIFKLPRSVI